MTCNVLPELHPFLVPVADLTIDPANARLHGPRSIDGIAASLEKFGQDIPVVASARTKKVVAGNGRLEAALRLGWTHIACLFRDDDEILLTARAVADNRTAELGAWREDKLAAALRKLQEADGDLIVGWTADEYAAAAKLPLAAATAPPAAAVAGTPPPAAGKTCPRCRHQFT